MPFEYKTVGGPVRGIRRRGAKTVADRVALAMEEIIAAEAVNGWDYMRTDLVAVEERSSLFARREQTHCSVLVFRREMPSRRQAGGEAASPVLRSTPVAPPAAAAAPATGGEDPLVLGDGHRIEPGQPTVSRPVERGQATRTLFVRPGKTGGSERSRGD